MSTSSVSTGTDLSSLLDAPYFGLLVSIFLSGMIIMQAWTYFNQYKDNWLLRLLVLSTVLLDFAASILGIISYRNMTIVHFGNVSMATSDTPIKQMAGPAIITAIIVFIVQIFFASRVYLLNQFHRVVPAFITLCATAGLDVGTKELMDPKTKLELGISFGLVTICDISVTIALIWTFWTSKTGFKKTDTMLYKLLQFTVTRGILITLFQVSFIATYVAYDPEQLKW
ncbi:hypothetical protein MPER_12626 [Moniliophthora perniciosa FA553]|nr:hypothetical protein MPER_12626 [Moniliophthora perniciosa FA553]